MRTVTDRFRTAILQSHQLATLAEVLDSAGNATPVPLVDGTVTLDQTAQIRGRCDITIVDDGTLGLVPNGPASLLAPYGNEIRLARGITYPDGTVELVRLGVFRIQDLDVDATPGGLELRLVGLDRSARFVDARFEEPYQVAAGTNYTTAIRDVLLAAWPAMPYRFAATTRTAPALIAQEGDDRWDFAQEMARSLSMRLYFDGDGVCVLEPQSVGGTGAPVAELAEGESGVLLSAGRRWTREGTFNRVIATGENTGEDAPPARGVATDENPLSPTYYFGPFGRVPRFYASPFITTDGQAAEAAASILARELGTTQQVRFGAVVLPHLEPDDVVRITRAVAGIDEDHIIDTLTIPLAAQGEMTGGTRAQVVS